MSDISMESATRTISKLVSAGVVKRYKGSRARRNEYNPGDLIVAVVPSVPAKKKKLLARGGNEARLVLEWGVRPTETAGRARTAKARAAFKAKHGGKSIGKAYPGNKKKTSSRSATRGATRGVALRPGVRQTGSRFFLNGKRISRDKAFTYAG